MPDYSSYKPTSDGDGRDYVQKWPAFVDRVGEDMDEKAPLIHSHDGGDGAVIAIGEESARPAGVEGFIFSNITDDVVEVLDASGNVKYVLVKPEALAGYISSLLITRPNTTDLTIAPFSTEINGKLCRLPTAITITPTGTAKAWIYIMAQEPILGNVLSASDLTYTETIPTRDATKGNAFYSADGTKRCVAAWKLASTGQPLAATLKNGALEFREVEEVYTNSSPPISTWLDVDMEVPFSEALSVYFQIYGHADTATGYVAAMNGDGTLTSNSWRYTALRVAASSPNYEATERDTNSSGEVKFSCSGGLDTLQVAVHKIEMPPQIGR